MRLDDECAFYTSRAPPSGPSRVCTNPVAKLLDWQDALVSLPIHSQAAGSRKQSKGANLGSFIKIIGEALAQFKDGWAVTMSFSLSSVLFQLVLQLLRTLRHEAPTSTRSCSVLILPFSPYLLSVHLWDWVSGSRHPFILQ